MKRNNNLKNTTINTIIFSLIIAIIGIYSIFTFKSNIVNGEEINTTTVNEATKKNKVKKPKQTSLKSCKKAKKGQIIVKWNAKKCSGYEICIATNKNFTHNKKTYVIKKRSTVKKTIKNLKNYKWYVKIRTYNEKSKVKAYSKWSKYKTVTINSSSFENEKLVGIWRTKATFGFDYGIWEFTKDGKLKITVYEDYEYTTVQGVETAEYELDGNTIVIRQGEKTFRTEYALLGEQRKIFVFKKPGEDDFVVLMQER